MAENAHSTPVPASRRKALATLAGFLAVPALPAAAALVPSVTPELSRLIRKCERIHDRLEKTDWDQPRWGGLVKAAGVMRCRLARHPSAGMPDTLAKVSCLSRIGGLDYFKDDLRSRLSDDTAYLSDVSAAIVLDLMQYEEARACA